MAPSSQGVGLGLGLVLTGGFLGFFVFFCVSGVTVCSEGIILPPPLCCWGAGVVGEAGGRPPPAERCGLLQCADTGEDREDGRAVDT